MSFLTKYTKLTHALAAAWAFLLLAYTADAAFATAVNNTAIQIYHALPASVAKIVASLFALAAPLWAFYRNGETPVGKFPTDAPKSSSGISTTGGSSLAVLLVMCLLGLSTVGLTGCTPNQQKTLAALSQTIGTSVASILQIENQTTAAEAVQNATNALTTAINHWQGGTVSSDILSAAQALQANIGLLPVNSNDQQLIDIALSAVESILTEFGPSTPVTNAQVRRVTLAVAIHSKSDYVKVWDAAIVLHPQFAAAKL